MPASKFKRSPGRPKSSEGEASMRDKVLGTASNLFMEFGYEPVSINMIAERAGVTKASVYYYFTNKAALFTTSVTEMMKRIRYFSNKIIEAHPDLRTRLEQLALTKLSRTHVEFESLMREAIPFLTVEQRDEIRKAEHSIHELLAEVFREAMDQGEIMARDPMLLSHAFSSLLMIGIRGQSYEKDYSVQQLSEAIVDLFWSGVSLR